MFIDMFVERVVESVRDLVRARRTRSKSADCGDRAEPDGDMKRDASNEDVIKAGLGVALSIIVLGVALGCSYLAYRIWGE